MRIDLHRIFPNAKPDILAGCQADLQALDDHGITKTRRRLTWFLAQMGHESGGLTIREENLRYSARRMTEVWPSRFPTVASAQPYANNPKALAEKTYGGRMGNVEPGDGYRYRGQGGIQITGREAYEAIGQIAGLDLVGHPELASDPRHYLRVACAFWTWKGLNKVCDTGTFKALTKRINGGYTGLADREEWLRRVERAVPQDFSTTPTQEVSSVLSLGARGTKVRALQQRLAELGYILKVDGGYGNRTRDMVLAFQADNGLEQTGAVDDAMWSVLDSAAPRPVSEERDTKTVRELADDGSRIAAQSLSTQKVAETGAVVTAAAGVAQKTGLLETIGDLADKTSSVGPVLETVKSIIAVIAEHWWIGAAGVLVAVALGARRIGQWRAEDHRTGKTT